MPRQKTILLISCASQKKSIPDKAYCFYQGHSFQQFINYAMDVSKADQIFICSAKYGLVPLYQEIEPYECFMKEQSRAYKADWGRKVIQQFGQHGIDLVQDKIVAFVHKEYRKLFFPACTTAVAPFGHVQGDGTQHIFLKALIDRKIRAKDLQEFRLLASGAAPKIPRMLNKLYGRVS